MKKQRKDERTVFIGVTECPYCTKIIEVKVKRKTMEPGKKAVTKDRVEVSKSRQTSLSFAED